MRWRRWHTVWMAAVMAAGAARGAGAQEGPPPADPETVQSAVLLLRTSMQVSPDGRHDLMLRALRHLRDPQLRPLFSRLAGSDHAILRTHGILGLAEADPQRQLDLVRLADVKDPAHQAQIVSAALDGDLLDARQCAQLLDWPGLDLAVKVVVAMGMVRQGQPPSPEVLAEAAKAGSLPQRYLAQLLLIQTDEAGAVEALRELDQSSDPAREQARSAALQTILRCGLDRAGPWAMDVASDQGAAAKLRQLALRAALRFAAPGAAELWRREFESDADAAQRMRLGMIVLALSPHLEPGMFDPLLSSDDPMLRRMGEAGAAVAARRGVAEAVRALLAMNHPVTNGWALGHAREQADAQDARVILVELIRAAADGPARNQEQRLYDAIEASQALFERDPPGAGELLRPLLSDRQREPGLAQAILVGLIRSEKSAPQRVLEGALPLPDAEAQRMAVVLLAKHGEPLTPAQMDDLSLAVRSPGMLALRVQAAWTYLKRTGQTETALAQVFGRAD